MERELAITALRTQGLTCDVGSRIALRFPQTWGMDIDVEWIRQALAQNPDRTQRGLAEAMGIDATGVSRMLKGLRQLKANEVQKVREYFAKASKSDITSNLKSDEGMGPLISAPLIKPTDWPRDLPVYGVAVAGSEGGIEFNGQVTDYLRRPPRLQAVIGAYAVYVHGDSMSPWRKNGDAVYVHPGLPCRVGDYVVVQIRPERAGDAPNAYIKELARRTERELRLRQFNPPKEITIPVAKVLSIHRILDWTELLGV